LFRPTFHHQRHAQRPFPAHPQGRQKSAPAQMPRNLREISESREKRIRQNARRQRAHATNPISQPTKYHSARRRAQQKTRCHLRHPRPHLRIRPARQHAQQRRPRHHREQPNFESIEQPSQKRRQQNHPLPARQTHRPSRHGTDFFSRRGLHACQILFPTPSLRQAPKTFFRRFAAPRMYCSPAKG
jgi:hypothetical protein